MSIEFHERIQDEKYQALLGTIIDDFYAKTKGVTLKDVIKSETNLDLVEVLMRYSVGNIEPNSMLVLMFVLGVYLASRDSAILPLDVN